MCLRFAEGEASDQDILQHLAACSDHFVPRLGDRVDLGRYAGKIHERAVTFEAWSSKRLVGLVAAYFNDPDRRSGYITSVSTVGAFRERGIASRLVRSSLDHGRRRGFLQVALQVARTDEGAIKLYRKLGFREFGDAGAHVLMRVVLEKEDSMGNPRDYDAESGDSAERRYAYNFDFGVMHGFMLRSFSPFVRDGSALELGSFRGDFTQRLLSIFESVTCVEASEEAARYARERLGDAVEIFRDLFERVSLPGRYDNVVITHVLEHLDDPVGVLRRINDEWLAVGARCFIVCPNANAPSRQIAVKMGLISHNAAVTPAEAEHGHRITYQLDTLERDARAGGLKVIHRSGIFFKALANFQWDRLLETDIISPEYLEGCYQVGQQLGRATTRALVEDDSITTEALDAPTAEQQRVQARK